LTRPNLVRFALAAAVATLGVLPGAAEAATTPTVTSLCAGTLSQPFSRWADFNAYTLAPGGDFEGGAAWTLSGGATVGAGSEGFAVTGKLGTRSLSVPAGGTAVSPDICIDPTRETFRFFARNASTSTTAKLRVEILYQGKSGAWMTIMGGIMNAAKVPGWQVSPVYSNSSNLALLSGLPNPPIHYRFTASGGAWQVDDVYVDPYRRG
jgi:hypothetical protein